jgi:P2 family phage contractile tail tube protein
MSNQVPETLINYEAYQEGSRLIGHTDVTMPNIQAITTSIQGAGIAGSLDVPVAGHFQDLTITVNFRTAHIDTRNLLTQKYHHLEFWGAIQHVDAGSGELVKTQHKIIVKAMPKSNNTGAFKPGEPQGRSLEFHLSYFKEVIDSEVVVEIDKFNFKYVVGGQDLLADVRAAMGL